MPDEITPEPESPVVADDPPPIPAAAARADPLLTMDGAESQPVTTGHTPSPGEGLEPADDDPPGPPERPQNAPTTGEPVAVFAPVRDLAVTAARATTWLPLEAIEQAIAEGEHALSVGPILDPTLYEHGARELQQQLRLLRAFRSFRVAVDEIREEVAA